MATSNFKVFAESAAAKDIETDSEYAVDSQRETGVVPGIAVPKMHNKLYKQATIMAAAIAQVIVQAGFDARDDDYTGLVANLRKTFAGSVNGIKPDEGGNVDLTQTLNDMLKQLYPRKGDVKITLDATNPGKRYPGTEWHLLSEGTFLMAAGEKNPVGSAGGSNTHTMSDDELAPHKHSVMMVPAGAHTHTRGTMNIKGGVGSDDMMVKYTKGAFYRGDSLHSGTETTEQGYWLEFDASRSWTGETSQEGSHTHQLTLESAGKGQEWDCRPKYMAAYIWICDKSIV